MTVAPAAVLATVLVSCTPPPAPAPTESGPDPAPLSMSSAEPGAATDEHSEVGGLAPGFPSDLIPLPDDAVILVTSAAQVGDADVQEVSLNRRTRLTTAEVVELYRVALVEAGFSEVAARDAALAAEAAFTRSSGDELVSIGVLDDGDLRTVTIGGRVRTTGS
ncbi:MAG TPA: hypothetical protein PKB06_03795 [Actinotalea sp.]|nr:hypothetical protein [Actinotalea sp.]